MELLYSFDPERFYLGKLCIHGHAWPSTQQSLRRIAFNQRGQRNGSKCTGCSGRQQSNWLLSFLDYKAMGWPAGQTLGKLCPKGHQWNGLDASLRSKGHCIQCDREKKLTPKEKEKNRLRGIAYREQDREAYNAKAKERQRKRKQKVYSDPELHEAILVRKRQRRAHQRVTVGAATRAAGLRGMVVPPGARLDKGRARIARMLIEEGHPPDLAVLMPLIEDIFTMENIFRKIGRLPSVAKLVMEEQRRYWADHPDAHRAYQNERKREYVKWRMMTDPEYVLYHRQKSKRRKALLRSSVGIQLTGRQVRQRFGEFGNACAYCGAGGVDLHIEHVVPISRGGTHTMGNIVPACQSCNFNKATHDVENWYRAQPFFCERRWKKVCRVLSWAKSSTGQLALL